MCANIYSTKDFFIGYTLMLDFNAEEYGEGAKKWRKTLPWVLSSREVDPKFFATADTLGYPLWISWGLAHRILRQANQNVLPLPQNPR